MSDSVTDIRDRAAEITLAGLEAVLNRMLALDPDAVAGLRTLEGKTLGVEVDEFPFRVEVRADNARIWLSRAAGADADAVLGGPIPALLRASRGELAVSEDSGLRSDGDAEVLEQFAGVLRRLDPDWEEAVSRAIGDLPARKLGNLARRWRQWASRARGDIARNAGDFLREEQRLAAPRWRVDEFMERVDTLRADVDRLAQRIDRLQR